MSGDSVEWDPSGRPSGASSVEAQPELVDGRPTRFHQNWSRNMAQSRRAA